MVWKIRTSGGGNSVGSAAALLSTCGQPKHRTSSQYAYVQTLCVSHSSSSNIFRHLQTHQLLVSTPQQMPRQVPQQMPAQVPQWLQKVLQVPQVELQAPLWENWGNCFGNWFLRNFKEWRWIGISHGYHQFLDKSSWNLLCLSAHEPLRCCDGSLCFQEAGCMSGFSTKGTKKSLSAASPSHGTWWPVCFWSSCWTKKNGLG